jgi:curved DNA-binding protein CbpA
LMLKYHPDRHAGDPQKQRLALEIAKKINQSFERIRSNHEGQSS